MATTLQEAFEENVRPFIDIIDELRSLGLDKDVSLPAVVVVGDQSAGKSSVLEAISGVQLPRGTNIVTRCPLELRLKKLHKNKAGELLSEDEQKNIPLAWKGSIKYTQGSLPEVHESIEDPSLVGSNVEEATNKLTESDTGISDSLIHLEVQSPSVPDLTLIDLPGIARVSVEGQSVDVPQQTKDLIRKYIKKPETIILAVIPCNVDIATTEALQLAQEFDEDGKRTLGVLTKPDLVDEGTENSIVQIVNGEKVKLALGYTVVKCRGQKDIEKNVSLENALEKEENFFKNNDILGVLYKNGKTGIRNLSHQLTKQLVEQIKRHMPELKRDINEKLARVNQELETYGDMLPENDHERQTYLINISMKLGNLLTRMSKAEHIEDDAINQLQMYAKIKEQFVKLGNNFRGQSPDRNDHELKEEIRKQIKDNKGKELPSFLSYSVFEKIVRGKLKNIKGPSNDCLKEVNKIVDDVMSAVIKYRLRRYEPLMMEVTSLMNAQRKKAEENTRDALKTIFSMEDIVFTQDVNFTRLMHTIEEEEQALNANDEQKKTPVVVVRNVLDWFTEGEKMDTEHMTRCFEAYFEVVITRLIDVIPMAISYHLVRQLMESVSVEIVRLSADPGTCEKLLKEDPEAVFTRKKLLEKQERLEKASIKLMKFGSTVSEIEVRPCEPYSQPCKNDGNCTDDGECLDGFKGSNCSEKIVPCEISPYKHGGICSNEENGDRNGYGGKMCERKKDALYSSCILDGKPQYIKQLVQWLGDDKEWRLCYRATQNGWRSNNFHSRCDHKGPTVTLISVGYYIFGGYSDIAWGGKAGFKQTTKSFLFSLRNKDNIKPFTAAVYQNSQYAIYTSPGYGATFGGHDIYIRDNAHISCGSYSNFGYTYKPPSGYDYGSTKAKSVLAGAYNFLPTEIEVFYLA